MKMKLDKKEICLFLYQALNVNDTIIVGFVSKFWEVGKSVLVLN